MDYFTKNKLLFWCVLILVLVNVATLGSLWLRRPAAAPGEAPLPPRDGQEIMRERLDLSDTQARQFQRIRDEHFARTRPLQEDIARLRRQCLDAVFADPADPEALQHLEQELETRHGQFERQLFAHFLELKAACPPEQVETLHTMLRNLVDTPPGAGPEGMRPPRPGMPGPGVRPEPPPGHRPPPR